MFGQGFNSGFFGGPNYIYKEDIFGDNSCIGLYTMDYDFSNSSGNDNDMGVFGNPDHGVSGGLNLGARFDGYNDSARAYPVSDLQGLTAVSISFWFKWDDSTSVSNYGHMVNIGDMGGVGNGDAFGIAVGDDGGSYNRVLYGWFPEGSLSTGQTVTDNVWHHVLMTYSGTTVKYYYDGNSTPIATQTRTSLSLPNSAVNRITVGHYAYNGNHHFKGDLDHLRVFNREIQSSELAALYNEKFYSPSATTNNIAYPITNTAYYKLDNSSKDLAQSSGKFNQGAIYSGNNGKITINNFATLTQVGISMWVNVPDWSSQFSLISRYGLIGSTDDREFAIYTYQGSLYASTYYNGNNGNAITISTSSYFSNNTWHHVAFTSDGSTQPKLYIDGVQRGTAQSNNNAYYSSSQPVLIGSFSANSAYNLTGRIDQVRIYDTALSSTDVSNLYAETASNTSTLSFPSGKTAIATYKLDGNSTDLSGNYDGVDTNITYAYDGTETDISYTFGRFGQAAVFNGSSSKIDTGISSISSPFAVSMWINEDVLDSGMFFANWNSTAADMYWQTTSDGRLRISIDGYSQEYFGTAGDVKINTWHHIAVTLSGGSYEVYLDGNSLGTSTTSVTTFSSGQNFMIGNSSKPSTPVPFDGKIDQVRIFSSALDSDQVTKLYNEKPETDTSTFKTVLYEGAGANQFTSNVGMDLETNGGLVWIKNRNNAYDHYLYDSVRGAKNILVSNSNIANTVQTNGLSSFEANGFFLEGNRLNVNENNSDIVAWCWKAGGPAVSNTNGSITSQVSANQDAGFSIVKYTGNLSAATTATGQSVGHGLSSSPELIIFKSISNTSAWNIFSSELDNWSTRLQFDTSAKNNLYSSYPIADPTSSVFYTNYLSAQNVSGYTHIAYCFHSVSGVSKVGSYSGTGATGNAITGLGFLPSWLMVKRTDSSGNSWAIFDNRRVETNGNQSVLFADTTTAESDYDVDFDSDGFTLNTTTTNANASGASYIYLAFK